MMKAGLIALADTAFLKPLPAIEPANLIIYSKYYLKMKSVRSDSFSNRIRYLVPDKKPERQIRNLFAPNGNLTYTVK